MTEDSNEYRRLLRSSPHPKATVDEAKARLERDFGVSKAREILWKIAHERYLTTYCQAFYPLSPRSEDPLNVSDFIRQLNRYVPPIKEIPADSDVAHQYAMMALTWFPTTWDGSYTGSRWASPRHRAWDLGSTETLYVSNRVQ